jgi:hypothetical protein
MASDKWERVLRIAFYGNQHSARFLLATAETIWFISLIWPGETFGRPTYSVMSQIAPELAWAAIFLATAICQWHIFLNGNYHTRLSVVFSGWNMTLWWFISVSMYLSVYPPPAAISGELALAFGASWVYVRSGYGHKGRRAGDA